MRDITYGRHHIDRADIIEVVKALKSERISQGPLIKRFETALGEYCRVNYAVAVSSGTAALHLACLTAGLNKGDEAITTPVTFVATANSILYTGAKPLFVDIDYKTVNIDPRRINETITKKSKAILPVHFAGLPCNMPRISSIAKERGLIVIEDACHALGAEYLDKGSWFRVGSCRHSDMTVFSFHPVKHITTGEGGAVTTNNKRLYKKLLVLRSHGIYRNTFMAQRYGPWYYQMRDLGFNYRITDFQCALGYSQLKRLNSLLEKRHYIARIYNQAFAGLNGINIFPPTTGFRHAYHLYLLRIDFKKLNITKQGFVNGLKKEGIIAQVHYIPIYKHPYYKKRFDIKDSDFPNSEDYYKETLSIPMYPSMHKNDIDRVIRAVKKVAHGS